MHYQCLELGSKAGHDTSFYFPLGSRAHCPKIIAAVVGYRRACLDPGSLFRGRPL
jgi:hypothetical protein